MKTGLIQGGIDSIWMVVHDSGELSAPVGRYDIGGLDGDSDEEYRLIYRVVANAAAAGPRLLFNLDVGANYGRQWLTGFVTNVQAGRTTGMTYMPLTVTGAVNIGDITFGSCLVYAKSGQARVAIANHTDAIYGTYVSSVSQQGLVWNNSSDNIRTISLLGVGTVDFGIGTRIILLKKINVSKMKTGLLNVKGKIMGAWQKIAETTLAALATSYTFSGLDGDADVLYNVIVRGRGGYTGDFYLNLNGDVGSNYGYQFLKGVAAVATAARGTTAVIFLGEISQNYYALANVLLYAKSGYVRTSLSTIADDITGTTVTNIKIYGQSWNNVVDKITSLVVRNHITNGLGVGTHIELWRLNL